MRTPEGPCRSGYQYKNGGIIKPKTQTPNAKCSCGSGKKFKKCCMFGKSIDTPSTETELETEPTQPRPKIGLATLTAIATVAALGEL